MKYLNYTSYANPDGFTNLQDIIQVIHGANLNGSQWSLTFFPNYLGSHGTWGFTTDDTDFWDRVVSRCQYYREIGLEIS